MHVLAVVEYHAPETIKDPSEVNFIRFLFITGEQDNTKTTPHKHYSVNVKHF